MMLRRVLRWTAVVLAICLLTGVGLFYYNANSDYTIDSGLTSIALNYDPDENSSSYAWNGTDITVYGGFVKGIQNTGRDTESLLIRALSPFPVIECKASKDTSISILLENINPELYANQIRDANLKPERTEVNALKFTLPLTSATELRIEPQQPTIDDGSVYVAVGDNRDGYDTFKTIVEQVNAINPYFIINNGDLVFNGKPNQYRLFDQSIRNLSTTVCLTLGNHDVRRNGREIYTKLYGPNYYSFGLGNSYFIFLDSSPGWAEKTAISPEQYIWLEKELQKAQGKQIYVTTHIPPTDPRGNTTPNEIPAYIDKVKQDSRFESMLDNYMKSASMDHGFQDRAEAERFQDLMTQYHVDVVYLSHIHSYIDYTIDDIHYIITGGAGAELLTTNSFYHYVVASFNPTRAITIMELPSPTNAQISRFMATAALFTRAMYLENRAAVKVFYIGLWLLGAVLVVLLVEKFRRSKLWVLTKDVGNYSAERFRVTYPKEDNERKHRWRRGKKKE